jgi:hypothetical protein
MKLQDFDCDPGPRQSGRPSGSSRVAQAKPDAPRGTRTAPLRPGPPLVRVLLVRPAAHRADAEAPADDLQGAPANVPPRGMN